MSIRHTLMKGVALSTLLVLVAGPAGAADSTTTTTRGTAATTSVPLHVEALDLPIDLGSTVLLATTDNDTTTLAPWSTVQLTLANIDGTAFGQVDVSSDGTTTSPGAEVDETTDVGSVGATVGNVFALSDESAGTATAALTTLTTNATVLNALGLQATITDVVSTVADDGATATHSLAVAGIDLDLAHVLGSVLAQLPLADLIALADALGVDVPVNLDPVHDVVTATEELVAAVAAAVTAADAVDTAVQALLDADGDGTLAALQSLEGDIAGAATLDALILILTDPLLESCEIGGLALANALQAAADCVDGLISDHLDVLGVPGSLVTLEGAVATYVDAMGTAANAADIQAGELTVAETLGDIAELIEGLLTADLLELGPIDVSQRVHAVGGQPDASSASHTCEVTTFAALGADPVEIADCDGTNETLTTVVDTITGTLKTLLDSVGGINADEVSLELFGTVEDVVTAGEDGWVRASSVMEVLVLTVPDITIDECEVAEGLVCGLGIDVDGTLATVLGISDDALTTAQATVDDAITSASELLAALDAEGVLDAEALTDAVDGVDATAVQEAVKSVVTLLTDALRDLIDGLSLGTAGGTEVPGAVVKVDPTVRAEHQVVTAAAEPDGPADPADPAPDTPGDDPTLPNTGGGAALLAILAIGAGTWLWRRREQE